MKKIIQLILLFLTLFSSGFCVNISTDIDTTKTNLQNLKIGDRLYFDVEIEHSDESQTNLAEESESEIFAIFSCKKSTSLVDTLCISTFSFVSSFFDTGAQTISSQKFIIQDENDTTYVYSDSIRLYVKSVLPDSAGTSIKDIFPPLSLHLTFWDIFFPLLLIAAIVLGIILFIRYKKGQSIIPPRKKKIEPAHIIALGKLDKMRLDNLLGMGRIKEFYVKISWICREYLENRFQMPILESTNFEIKRLLKSKKVLCDSKFLSILKECDRVKYSKHIPKLSEAEPLIGNLEDLIIKTKPIETDEMQDESNRVS